MLDLASVGNFIVQFGLPLTMLIVLVWAGVKKWYVFGWTYEALDKTCERRVAEAQRERDAWRELALQGTHIAGQLSRLVPPREPS